MDADGLSLDELDISVLSLKDNLTEGEVPSIDRPKAVVPDFKPSVRRKRRTEVENLEIDLKGWNYVSCNVRSLLSDQRPSQDINNFVFDEEQSGNNFYESFTETQSFDDYVLLTKSASCIKIFS